MTILTPPMVFVENVPDVLTARKRFVAYRFEARAGEPKPAKVPYSSNSDDKRMRASSTAPAHWLDFETAVKYAQVAGLDGIMRAFDASDGIVGIDFDNCRDPETGELTEKVAEYVKRLDTYTEVSPSGKGVKLWAYGTLPPHGRKRGDVEMYNSARFFTVTGQHVAGTPTTVAYRPDAILAIHREVWGDAPDPTAAADDDPGRPIPALEIGDEDVIRLASESQHNGERFRRLWSGDTSDYATDENDGESEADCALAELLAYYGGPDRERIERLMLRSGLVREKWDRPDYLPRTIDRALRGKTRFYGDCVKPPPAPVGSDGASGCSCEQCPHRAEEFRLRGLIFDRDDLIESQQAIIRAHNGVERKLRADVERLNRRIYADYRLSKVKTLTSAQKDTIRAIARVATGRAEHFDNDAPIITGQTLGAEIGKHESTARAAAEAVCSLPGSPVRRVSKYRDDGQYGQLTTYELAVRDPAEILEQFVTIAENLEERKPSRPQPPRCPDHPNAKTRTVTRHECAQCGKVLVETRAMSAGLCVQNPRIGTDSPPVDESVSIPVQVARIDDDPEAAAAAALDHQDVDSAPSPVSLLDYAAMRPVERPKRCAAPGCRAMEFRQLPDGSWRCLRSGHDQRAFETFTPSAEWQEIPDGYACPPGGEFRLDFTTGRNWARWPEVAAVSGGGE